MTYNGDPNQLPDIQKSAIEASNCVRAAPNTCTAKENVKLCAPLSWTRESDGRHDVKDRESPGARRQRDFSDCRTRSGLRSTIPVLGRAPERSGSDRALSTGRSGGLASGARGPQECAPTGNHTH